MKSLLKRLEARQLLHVAIAVPVILLLMVDWLQWRSIADYQQARESVNHFRATLLNLESLLSCMTKAESGQRGYLLTHKASYLEP